MNFIATYCVIIHLKGHFCNNEEALLVYLSNGHFCFRTMAEFNKCMSRNSFLYFPYSLLTVADQQH